MLVPYEDKIDLKTLKTTTVFKMNLPLSRILLKTAIVMFLVRRKQVTATYQDAFLVIKNMIEILMLQLLKLTVTVTYTE